VNGNVKLEQAACGGSQWRMGPTFFQMLLVLIIGLDDDNASLRINSSDDQSTSDIG